MVEWMDLFSSYTIMRIVGRNMCVIIYVLLFLLLLLLLNCHNYLLLLSLLLSLLRCIIGSRICLVFFYDVY